MSLYGSTALVTGGSGGIGEAIAVRLAEADAHVWVHYRNSRRNAESVCRRITELGGSAETVQADLTDPGEVDGMFARVADHGELDVLVNNAGIYPAEPLLSMSHEQWRHVFKANTESAFLCLQAAARIMSRDARESDDPSRARTSRTSMGSLYRVSPSGPSIINLTSLSVHHPAAAQAHYNASKAALLSLTRTAAQEFGPLGIRVNAISPGLIDRPDLSSVWPEGVRSWTSRCPLNRLGTADDVADACLFLTTSLASWVSGQELIIDGGISAAPAY
ncbi:SDR family NAD(P)-dependent oxidoreductase [Streptomyces sp. NPDC057271]|uniref:SDR family NAD(P)-dependent oxidoreductase n=1 Tax=unclassified Streptomyces TaxID=2593676 RepID=UPI00362E1A9C